MTHIFLSPVDVWLFRDGRPFDVGQRAESLFPPYPTVVYGAIRSHYLAEKKIGLWRGNTEIETTIGKPDDYSKLSLRGPFLAKKDGNKVTRYFPQPADAFSEDKDKHWIRAASVPEEPQGIKTSLPDEFYLLGLQDDLEKGEERLWLTEEALKDYFEGKIVEATPSEELFARENRFGIGVESAQQTVKEGMLFEVEFIRAEQGMGLLVEMAKGYADWPDKGVMQIGGESRAAQFETVTLQPSLGLANSIPKRFKVYFATPAYFEGGYIPNKNAPNDWSKFFKGKVTLRAAALNRYESLGGFDWTADPKAAHAHRAAKRYVPAGSVYYFDMQSADTRPQLIQPAITDFGAEIGFGQVIIPEKEW